MIGDIPQTFGGGWTRSWLHLPHWTGLVPPVSSLSPSNQIKSWRSTPVVGWVDRESWPSFGLFRNVLLRRRPQTIASGSNKNDLEGPGNNAPPPSITPEAEGLQSYEWRPHIWICSPSSPGADKCSQGRENHIISLHKCFFAASYYCEPRTSFSNEKHHWEAPRLSSRTKYVLWHHPAYESSFYSR